MARGMEDGTRPSARVTVAAGLFSGVVLAGALNPWDRALYLSVVEERAFLHRANWTHPYHGFLQSLAQRTISGGTYFALQGLMEHPVHDVARALGVAHRPWLVSAALGVSAGALNGMVLNQLAAVKYHAWQRRGVTFAQSANRMWRHGGMRPFVKGMHVTGLRDLAFGCVYETMRTQLRTLLAGTPPRVVVAARASDASSGAAVANTKPVWALRSRHVASDMLAGATATVVSGPLNYVRNMTYAVPPSETPPGVWACLVELRDQACRVRAGSGGSTMAAVHFLQERLRVGWGTARVAVGMALGQQLFDWARHMGEDLVGEESG